MKKLLIFIAFSIFIFVTILVVNPELEVTHYNVELDTLPNEFKGFKIAQISDLHDFFLKGMIDEIDNFKPDIIVLTGDILDRHTTDASRVIDLSRDLTQIADTYYITGNHDTVSKEYGTMIQGFAKYRVDHLMDETVILKRGNAKISLSGIDDPRKESNKECIPILERSLRRIKPAECSILLFHRANLFDTIAGKFDLIISGHLHGGQARLPLFGGLIVRNFLFPKYTDGEFKSGKTTLIVSRGIQNNFRIPRINNRPELVLITLK